MATPDVALLSLHTTEEFPSKDIFEYCEEDKDPPTVALLLKNIALVFLSTIKEQMSNLRAGNCLEVDGYLF